MSGLWSKGQLEDPEILALLLSYQIDAQVKSLNLSKPPVLEKESSKSLRWSVLLHLWLHLSSSLFM